MGYLFRIILEYKNGFLTKKIRFFDKNFERLQYVKKKLEESSGYVFYHDVAVWGLESMKKTYIDTIKIFANLK